MEKVNLVPEFLEIATSYTFGSFQACFFRPISCRFLDQESKS